VFGEIVVRKSDGKAVPTRLIGEQHVQEDLGCIPTIEKWLENLPREAWMGRPKQLSKMFEDEKENHEAPPEYAAYLTDHQPRG
jgi:hypothetical protein